MSERTTAFSAPMVRAILRETDPKTMTRRLVKPSIVKALEFLGGGPEDEPATSDSVSLTWGRPTNGHARLNGAEQWLLNSSDYPNEGCMPIGVGYGKPGDTLWVREGWRAPEKYDDRPPRDIPERGCTVFYEAGGSSANLEGRGWTHCWDWPARKMPHWAGKYRLPMFMPRWASRITLRITDVRIERLQEINSADAIAEGLTKLSKDNGRTWKYGIPDRDGLPGDDDDGWHWHDWNVDPVEAYHTLWNRINLKRALWASNPFVWVVTFKRISQ